MLRAFRDGVLAHMPGEQEEIEEYYEIAPDIVAAINQRKDATQGQSGTPSAAGYKAPPGGYALPDGRKLL